MVVSMNFKTNGEYLNHVEIFATFDALDNVSSGYSPRYDVPSVGTSLASCSSRITGLYLDVFRKCSEFCGVKLQRECSATFRVINRIEDVQLYLNVYRKYSRVSGKVPCSSAFVGGVGDGLDKRKLQPSGHSDVFEAYLALCSISSLCGPSASLLGRSFDANPNAVTITGQLDRGDSQNSYPVSRDGGNTRENSQLSGWRVKYFQENRSPVLTSASTVDTTSVASAGTSYTSSDFRDFDRRCRYCGASFWYVECLKRNSHNQSPEYHLCCGGGEAPRFLKLYIYDTDNEVQNKMHHFGGIDNSQLELGIAEDSADFDVIIQHRDELEQRVNKLHPSYMSLQFPLLFIYGQRGYHTELTLKSANGVGRGKRVTMLAYYRYQLHFRLQQYDLLFRRVRLFQHYVVGDRDGYKVGGRIILPMSFTGGPRYMYAHYLDALAICQKLGNPQFFITFTCNVNWPEIKRFMSEYPHLTAFDRADVVCRVFEQKIQALISFLKEERIFGDVTVVELPDPRIDPEGYNVVSELMIHGPCGAVTLKAPCMKVVALSGKKSTTLTEWFAFNEDNEVGRHLSYLEFPSEFVWYSDRKSWSLRKNSKSSIGRLAYVHPTSELRAKHRVYSMMTRNGRSHLRRRVALQHHKSYGFFFPTYSFIVTWQIRLDFGEKIILSNCGKSLHAFGIPPPPQDLLDQLANRLLMEERNYNREELAQLKDESELIFVYGHGGTGKTFLWKTIISSLRSEGNIVLVVASLALDRSLIDIVDKPYSLFGIKSVLVGGDFRKTLLVKKGASKIEVISSCIYEYALWPSFKVFTLKHNMRLARPDTSLEERSLVNSFASWLLDVGEGKISEPADEDPENTSWVHIPPAYCLPLAEQGLSKLIDFIYD
uniref:ATP-dependent DNA helicase n=1 Tax=Tanacetum cinerariifolium TaxID=118510 RepID=A0A6L2NVE1_TANCI|nr:DNA helicase [Tanacetum cinerariifolium]